MTLGEHEQHDDETATPESASTLESLIGRIAFTIRESISKGEIADLRRSKDDQMMPPVFWRLSVSLIEPAGWLRGSEGAVDEREHRWSAILAVMAWLDGFHDSRRALGASLAESGYSEVRFSRLLRASDNSLRTLSRDCARYLAAKGSHVDVTQIARLLLSDGRSNAESVRRHIARDYYRSLNTQ